MSRLPPGRRALAPGARKLLLTIHVIVSVGLIGADSFLVVLGLTGLWSGVPELVRASYLAMELLVDVILLPGTVAALATGVLLALGTPWGLTRYHWVLAKFVLTIAVLTALILLLRPRVQEAAAHALGMSSADLVATGIGEVAAAATIRPLIAMAVLLTIVILAMYKPWGKIRADAK